MMNASGFNRLLYWVDQYLADDRLTEEQLIRKRWAWIWMVVCFFGVSCMMILAFVTEIYPVLWFGIAMLAGFLIAIPLFKYVRQFELVLNITFTFFILITFVAMLQTGGISSSLGFVFIGMNVVMASVLAGNMRWTVGMFILWAVTIILLGILDPYLETPAYITPEINRIWFVVDAVWINACILILVFFFMEDQKRFERAEADRLKKLDEAKTQLYTHISHEFRTPLTLIRGIAEQMEKNPAKWKKRGPEQIRSQSNVLLRLVSQMLDIAKIEADSMPLDLIHGDVVKYVQYVTGLFQGLAESRNIRLEFKGGEKPVFMDYDPGKLMEILDNLVSNALKFTPAGGEVIIGMQKHQSARDREVLIRVSDTGRGIPEEAKAHIFDRFYQVPDANRQTQGSGLGLALTKELVGLMGGKIEVESTVGQGTAFTVSLPVSENAVRSEDHGISAIVGARIPEPAAPSTGISDIKMKPVLSDQLPVLLIVEDNHEVMAFLASILEKSYVVQVAGNGEEGLEKAREIIPDLILTDVMMPKMDGFELVRRLRADERTDHIPVMILTAMGDDTSKLKGLELGADHFLVKPFREEELIIKLHNLLEVRRRMQSRLGVIQAAGQGLNGSQYRRELQFMSKVNRFLEDHYQDDKLSVGDICAAMHMSRPQFYRKFTALTDQSIGRYLRSYRLHKAADMIRNDGLNVTEAALESGFRNVSHFSTSFREEFGYAPSETQ